MSVFCVYKQASAHALRPLKFPRLSTAPSPTRTLIRPHTLPTRRLSTMSVNIVLPDLPNFVQQRVTAIYSAKTEADFDAAFDAFVAQDVRITLNGKHATRATYKKLLQGETSNVAAGNGAEIQFQGVVSVPSDSSNPDAIGVGTFLSRTC